MNIREIAYKSLIRIEKEKRYSSLELDSVIASKELTAEERSFLTRLVYGVTERKITLDYVISLFSSKGLSRLDLSTLILLRLGAYQILYLDKIPSSAAVNECVKLAARYSSRSKGFINAVLRKITQLDEIPLPDLSKDAISYYSVKYSMPADICRMWINDYPEHGERLFEFVNSSPFITLRVNTLKTDVQAVKDSFAENAEKCTNAPFGVKLTRRIPTEELSFDDGLYYVQDEASQIAVQALDTHKGQTVIDVCSCPGGKAFGCAINMFNNGRIFSFDLHSSKLSLIDDGAKRLGISIIETREHDSTAFIPELEGIADRVICDVPCSGFGVVAKKSDLRYKDLSTLDELSEIQYKILCESVKYLKDDGVLVYSTCTLRKAENEDVVNKFLSQHKEYTLLPFTVGNISCGGMLTLFPHLHGTDGFFVAKIGKR